MLGRQEEGQGSSLRITDVPMGEDDQVKAPIIAAIEVVETALERVDRIFRDDLLKRCQEQAPEAKPLLDHTIQLLVHGGFVKRFTTGPYMLGYAKTDEWDKRDRVLWSFRPPVKYERHRTKWTKKKPKGAKGVRATRKPGACGKLKQAKPRSRANLRLAYSRDESTQLELAL